MAAISQVGTAVKVGFANNTLTGYVMNGFTRESTGEQKVIKDENNATQTILVSDEGERITFDAIVLNTGSLTMVDVGATVTINSVVYRVESYVIESQREETILRVTAIKEDSMTYT